MSKRKKISKSSIVVIIFAIAIPFLIFNHHRYERSEGVIIWDVKSYYAYLPAVFINNDISLKFIDDDPKFYGKWIWPVTTPTGNRCIVTTMGLSVMYSPFFGLAHAVASSSDKYEAHGYSKPYHVALTFSTLFYFLIGLLLLRKLLRQYFDDWIVALTLLAIGAGTNLFYYVVYEAPMSHGYNFVLFILFIYILEKWNRSFSLLHTILLGLVGGFIALIRPTNILVLLLIPFFNVLSFNDLKERFLFLLKQWPKFLVMAGAFVLVWIPQFLYWKHVAGQFFYFSYDELDGQFFWGNPQIWNILFSYKKGWFIYTPLMLIAVAGIYNLFKQKSKYAFGITVFLIADVYVLSCWWAWWNGGGFSIRSMVDFYGLMAFPLAAILKSSSEKRVMKYALPGLVLLTTAFTNFQVQQYRRNTIHYWWMNKEAYWETFLKLRPTCKYWKVVMFPDYEKAKKGIYQYKAPHHKDAAITDQMLVEAVKADVLSDSVLMQEVLEGSDSIVSDSLIEAFAVEMVKSKQAEIYFKKLKLDFYEKYISNCNDWREEMKEKAEKRNILTKEMIKIEAERVYELYSEKYE